MIDKVNSKSNNCLNLIRIIAALQVLFGHGVEHLKLPISEDLLRLSYFFRGVPIFFALSGYLIWFSVENSASYVKYLKKRFWRVYPELWASVAIDVVVIVFLHKGWDILSLVLFAIGQGTIFQFWTPDCLRSYGVGTPNGALWTIGVMIQFYIVVWLFYLIMKKRTFVAWITGFFVSFITALAFNYIFTSLITNEIMGKSYNQSLFGYFWLFYIGMFIARFSDRLLPFLVKYWFVFIIIGFVFFWTRFDLYSSYYLLWSIFLIFGLIGFAYRFPTVSVNPDISYGIFLYHMIIMNVFVHFHWTGHWYYLLIVILLSAGIAWLSAITIGKYSSKQKSKISLNIKQ